MLCALTARRLKPTEGPDEAVCFGFFDGTVDELRRTAAEQGYAEQLEAIAPFVDSVGADGLYEIVEEWTAPPRAVGLTA